MEVVRKKLYPEQLYDPKLTYDGMTDGVLYDNLDAPNLDPRHNGSVPLPASGTLACDNAATMVALLRLMTEQLTAQVAAGASATQITSALLALLVILGWVALFVAIVAALVAAALTAGAEALEAAFTETTWDDLLCILYCHTDENGQITNVALGQIRAEVNALLPALAAVILNYYFDTLGEAGLNNASVALGGLETGVCTSCACAWCYEWTGAELAATPTDWAHVADLSYSQAYSATLAGGLTLTKMEMGWTWNGLDAPGALGLFDDDSFGSQLYFSTNLATADNPAVWEGNMVIADGLSFGLNTQTGSGGGTVTITSLRLEGTGVRPAWTGGNEC